jgi:antitoxin HigA-1
MRSRYFHPGVVLLTEYMQPGGLDSQAVARQTMIDGEVLDDIISGAKPMSADVALRLAPLFSTRAQFWMNLQTQYELAEAELRLHNERNMPA